MKTNYLLIAAIVIALVITGAGLYAWQQQNSRVDQESTQSAEPATSATPTPDQTNKPSASQTPQPVEQTVSLYLVALNDASNNTFDCRDSLVGVDKQLTTTTPLTDAITSLLAINDQYYGESGLYSALWQSNLTVESVSIANGEAKIALNGELVLGGTCDSPRVKEQLTKTATQFASVNSAVITLNGQPLDEALSTR